MALVHKYVHSQEQTEPQQYKEKTGHPEVSLDDHSPIFDKEEIEHEYIKKEDNIELPNPILN